MRSAHIIPIIEWILVSPPGGTRQESIGLTRHDVDGGCGRKQGEDGVQLLHWRRNKPLLRRVQPLRRARSCWDHETKSKKIYTRYSFLQTKTKNKQKQTILKHGNQNGAIRAHARRRGHSFWWLRNENDYKNEQTKQKPTNKRQTNEQMRTHSKTCDLKLETKGMKRKKTTHMTTGRDTTEKKVTRT